ncbi:MAG: transposase [Candidatus Omnitrophica bacterium]|nr:transposase [Candidatus Omnitrophota bacterium]
MRGNNRQAIFLDDIDYQQYLLELRRSRDEYPYRLLAFALMPNHVHLVMEALPDACLSDVMHQVGKSYTRYFNGQHDRVGHLYQGRFYSNLVNRESYLLEVTRYVHLNPFRASLVRRPAEYLWSSYRTYLGLERDLLDLVSPQRILELFGTTFAEQIERYRSFVEQLVTEEEKARAWLRKLYREKLIPPQRWLFPRPSPQKVPGTFSALGSTRYF